MEVVGVRHTEQSREQGFTLIELLVAMVLFGTLIAIAVGPWRNYQLQQEHLGSTRGLVSVLRNAQISAVAEETTYRVDLSGQTATVYRLTGGTYVKKITRTTTDTKLTYASPLFTQPDGTTSSSVYFYARGSATKGSVQIVRSGRSKVYTVSVEGLTARVSYS